jgi:hypothetical protein
MATTAGGKTLRDVTGSLVVFAAMLVCPGMAWTGPEEGDRVAGGAFSVPIPNGFVVLEAPGNPQVDALRSAGGLVLVQKERPATEDAYRAQIVISPAEPSGEIDLQDKETCTMVAYRGAGSVGGTMQAAGVAELSSGAHCQYTVRYPDKPNRAATATIFSTSGETWVVTCTLDVRDMAALSACTQVVNGWKFMR